MAVLDRVLPSGFALAAALWLAAFVLKLPWLGLEGAPLGFFLVGTLAAASLVIGAEGAAMSVRALAVTGLVNVLLVSSLVHAPEGGWLWVPASLAFTVAVGLAGGLAAPRLKVRARRWAAASSEAPASASQSRLAVVVVLSTLALMSIGALVTSAEAGLAVPDWPNSYGYTMFLFPFSKMVGGIYFEHAHRLFGSLVGLETLVLCVWLWVRPPVNRGLRLAGTGALLLVIGQGLLGGMRVVLVNHFGSGAALDLAVVHAITAQLFLSTMTALAWSLASDARGASLRLGAIVAGAPGASRLVRLLLVALFAQVAMGAVVRHLHAGPALVLHITMGVILGLLTFFAGRSARDTAPGRALMGMPLVLVSLGVASWWVTTRMSDLAQVTSAWIVLITAAHVVVAAMTIALVVWLSLELGAPLAQRGGVRGAAAGNAPGAPASVVRQ